jgi:hypothetical protein
VELFVEQLYTQSNSISPAAYTWYVINTQVQKKIKFMKHPLKLLLVAGLVTGLIACDDDNKVLEQQAVNFTLSVQSTDNENGRTQSSIPDGAEVLISITRPDGSAVFTYHRIGLLALNDEYITEPLKMSPGNYVVTDFMVVKDSSIVFLVPKAGSPLSGLSKTLPFNITISKNSVANFSMDVVAVDDRSPEDFGYAAFDVNVVHPLKIAVYREEGGKLYLTNAKAKIYDGQTLLSSNALSAATNTIAFRGNVSRTYTLVVDKPGYSHTRTFTYNALKNEFGSEPIPIYLEETLDIYILSRLREQDMSMELTGSGEITVRWGDTGEPSTTSLPYSVEEFLPSGNYKVRITGDLDAITGFNAFSYSNGITSIDGIHYLTALKSFYPGQYITSALDLTNNRNLESIFIMRPELVSLPGKHHINHLSTVYYGSSSNPHLERLSGNILENAADQGIYNGYFQITITTYPYELSPLTLQNLQMLQDEYGWEVYYE